MNVQVDHLTCLAAEARQTRDSVFTNSNKQSNTATASYVINNRSIFAFRDFRVEQSSAFALKELCTTRATTEIANKVTAL